MFRRPPPDFVEDGRRQRKPQGAVAGFLVAWVSTLVWAPLIVLLLGVGMLRPPNFETSMLIMLFAGGTILVATGVTILFVAVPALLVLKRAGEIDRRTVVPASLLIGMLGAFLADLVLFRGTAAIPMVVLGSLLGSFSGLVFWRVYSGSWRA